MKALLSSIANPKAKRKMPAFLTTMYCLDCGQLFAVSRMGRPCIHCASESTVPAANWSPAKYGMPKLNAKVKG